MVFIELIEAQELEAFQLGQRCNDEMDDILGGKQGLAYGQDLKMRALR